MIIPFQELYEKILLIRKFESRLLELFSKGELFGTTHTCVGQEAIAVTVASLLRDSDIVFSNHRGHGHYLAKTNDPLGLLAEIMGREIGACGGRGGSQHLCNHGFYSNGIQGGYLANALGMAVVEKYRETGNIVVAFIGDGTFGEGAVYETLNLASLMQAPILIVVENNMYAQTTPIEQNLAGSIVARAEAFSIESNEIESNDVSVLYPVFHEVISKVRERNSPYVQVVRTYRLNAHSKGDDFRDKSEIEKWREKDPLRYFDGVITEIEANEINSNLDILISSIEEQSRNAGFAKLTAKEV